MPTLNSSVALTTQTAINDTTEEQLTPADIDTSAAFLIMANFEIDNTSGSVTNGVILRAYGSIKGTAEMADVPFWERLYVPTGVALERVQFAIDVAGQRDVELWAIAAAATDDYDVGGDYAVLDW